MLDILVKDAHVSWDSNHDILSDIDLHQNEELVERAEDITNRAQVNPFVSVYAEQVLFIALFIRAVDNEVATGHGQQRESAESKVGDEEALRLLQEHFFVVAESVRACWRQIVPVNHVASVVKDDIVNLVNQDDAHDCNKVLGVDVAIAIIHPE